MLSASSRTRSPRLTGPCYTEAMKFPLTLDPAVVETFRNDGFVLTPGVFSAGEIARFREAVDTEVAARTAGDSRSLADKSRYEQSFIQCMRLWETSPGVRVLSCDARLAGIAAQLLGEEEMLLWQDQALYKEPGGETTTPHQDQPFWPIGNAPLVSAWIPLVDVDEHNGAMAYVPGSHHCGKLKVVDITHTTEPYDILEDPELGGRKPVQVNARAGDVVWHHGFSVHQATANQSDEVRRVFTTVYLARGYPREKSWPVFPLDRAGVEVGESMEGEGMPQVWPPPDSLPEAPGQRGQATGPQH